MSMQVPHREAETNSNCSESRVWAFEWKDEVQPYRSRRLCDHARNPKTSYTSPQVLQSWNHLLSHMFHPVTSISLLDNQHSLRFTKAWAGRVILGSQYDLPWPW